MSAETTIGDFAAFDTQGVNPRIRLALDARDFDTDWRRYNLVANYVAEFAAFNFEQKDRAENLVSTVLYELLAHMAACADDRAKLDIRLYATDQAILFEVQTNIAADDLSRFVTLIEELNHGKADDLFAQLLESNMAEPSDLKNFGLVMVAHDYRARISAQIRASDRSSIVRLVVGREEIEA